MSGPQDSVDQHVARWTRVLPDLDPDEEGAITRMQLLVRHLGRARRATLAGHDLEPFEYETLHALAGRGAPFEASPSELATELQMSPAAMTGRIDALEQRHFLRRKASPTDRRKVIVQLTDAGHRAWRAAIDGMGDEEQRILAALTRAELRQLDGLLRRLVLVVERE